MRVSTWRAQTLARYQKEKRPEDGLENALLCEKYSEEVFPASGDDATYWLTKAIEIREKLYGKDSIENVRQYERLAYIYADESSGKNALRWYRKALRARETALGEWDMSLVPVYVSLAELYGGFFVRNVGKCGKCVLRAKEIEERHRPADNPTSFYVYQALAMYYNVCGEECRRGGLRPQEGEEYDRHRDETLRLMADSAVKEFGPESCEAAACLEKYIHDVKLPPQERLEIAGKVLKVYYEHEEEFERYRKKYDPISDFIQATTPRIEADIWCSWSSEMWFSWDRREPPEEEEESEQELVPDRSYIGWGIRWIRENVSEEIAESLIAGCGANDQKMIRRILEEKEMRPPVQ